MSKKIEMNYKNSSGAYEPLYPNIVASNVTGGYDQNNSLLSPTTAQKLGLPSGSSPDQAFNQIYEGKAEKVGDIFLSTRTSVPSNWGLCNGVEINQSQYPQLYDIIKQKFIPFQNYLDMGSFYPNIQESNAYKNTLTVNGMEYYVYKESYNIHFLRRSVGSQTWDVNVTYSANAGYVPLNFIYVNNIIALAYGDDDKYVHIIYTSNLNFTSSSDFSISNVDMRGGNGGSFGYAGGKWIVGSNSYVPSYSYSTDLNNWTSIWSTAQNRDSLYFLGDYIYWREPSDYYLRRKNMATLGAEETLISSSTNIISGDFLPDKEMIIFKNNGTYYYIHKQNNTLKALNLAGLTTDSYVAVNQDKIIIITNKVLYYYKINSDYNSFSLLGTITLGDDINVSSGTILNAAYDKVFLYNSSIGIISLYNRPIFTDQDYYAYIIMG